MIATILTFPSTTTPQDVDDPSKTRCRGESDGGGLWHLEVAGFGTGEEERTAGVGVGVLCR